MADNSTMGGSVDVIRDIDRAGVKTQVAVLDKGGAASENLWADNGLIAGAAPVKFVSLVSTLNSSTALLGVSAVFTGTGEDISAYSSVIITVFTDQVSATDGLSIQQSSNGTSWDFLDTYTIPASTGKTFMIPVQAKFFRVVYTNGSTIQTVFRLQVLYSQSDKRGTSVRPQDGRSNENDMDEMLGYLMGYNGTTWDRVRTVAKGIQATNAVSVQDMLDSGRAAKLITLDSFAVAATTETLNTIAISTDGATPATGNSYTITAGKRFRVQSIVAALHTIAGNTTAVNVIVRIRVQSTAPAIVSSPLQMVIVIPGIATANGASTPVNVPIPDGWEILPGAGIGVTTTCVGFVATTAAPKVDVSIVGFEY